MSAETVFKHVELPLDVKAAVIEEAQRGGSNMNDVIVGHLAKKYGVAFDPSGWKPQKVDERRPVVILKMPRELRREINARAGAAELSSQDLMVRDLCAKYGLRFTPGIGRGHGRRSRSRRAAAEAA